MILPTEYLYKFSNFFIRGREPGKKRCGSIRPTTSLIASAPCFFLFFATSRHAVVGRRLFHRNDDGILSTKLPPFGDRTFISSSQRTNRTNLFLATWHHFSSHSPISCSLQRTVEFGWHTTSRTFESTSLLLFCISKIFLILQALHLRNIMVRSDLLFVVVRGVSLACLHALFLFVRSQPFSLACFS